MGPAIKAQAKDSCSTDVRHINLFSATQDGPMQDGRGHPWLKVGWLNAWIQALRYKQNALRTLQLQKYSAVPRGKCKRMSVGTILAQL